MQRFRVFNNKIKQMNNKNHPEGGKTHRQTGRQADRQTGRQADRQTGRQADRQTGRQADRQTEDWCTVNMKHSRRKTTGQHRTADTRRLYRETNEGNEGDTAGATETMIK